MGCIESRTCPVNRYNNNYPNVHIYKSAMPGSDRRWERGGAGAERKRGGPEGAGGIDDRVALRAAEVLSRADGAEARCGWRVW